MIAGVDRADWLAALSPSYHPSAQRADCNEHAWSVFKSDYLRPEAPTLTSCYRRMKAAAVEQGWQPIPSERALRRRLEAEVPRAVQVLAREGRDTAKTLYPAQRRTRSHLHAMQAVNMDGHKLDVFVRLSGDRIGRVHLLALVAWRLSESENKETVRLCIGDMVERYGIPDAIYLDNGRAFASKWITGGTANRYRFKVREEDPRGLLTALGVEINWTTPYSGQSKPIERSFRDLADAIAKHPFCAGAYTGNTPDAKPENYASRAVPFEPFRDLVAAQIAEHNARPGRKTPTVNGRSFDHAFSESLNDAGSIVRWPSKAQRSLWLLAAERIRTRKGSGEIHLFGNRYWHPALNALAGGFVTIRFDPDNLALPLKVYDERVAATAVAKVQAIHDAIPFLDLTRVAEKIDRHPRMARHAASIASNPNLANFQRAPIEALAAQHGIKFKEVDGGRLRCRTTDEAKLLELLDARRYHLDLQGDGGDPYRATARQKVSA